MAEVADCHRLRQFTVSWQFKQWSWQNLAEFHGLAELGRIWQKRQIAVDCGKLRSHTQSLLAESVETGSGVSRVSYNITLNRVSYIQTATTKEELPVLGIKASGHYLEQVKASCLYMRQVAVTCRRGTSVVRNLKFLTPFSKFSTIKLFNHHCNLLEQPLLVSYPV